MQYQLETRSALARLRPGSVSYASAILGAGSEEPLLVGLDSLLRYAKAYEHRFASRLAEDHVLGPAWLSAAKGFRALLNGDGAVAMERPAKGVGCGRTVPPFETIDGLCLECAPMGARKGA